LARGEEAFGFPADGFGQFGRAHEGKGHFFDHHLLAGDGNRHIPGFDLLFGQHLPDGIRDSVAVHDVTIHDGIVGHGRHPELLEPVTLCVALPHRLQFADFHAA